MDLFGRKKEEKRFDFFTDFEELDKYMQTVMNEFMRGFPEPGELHSGIRNRPVRFGFSIKFDKNGRPLIREFGNVKRSEGRPVLSDRREPLADVNYSEKDVTITAELPGVQKKEINISVGRDSLTIDVENKEFPYFKEIPLGESVDRKSLKTEFKNGILEITLKKK